MCDSSVSLTIRICMKYPRFALNEGCTYLALAEFLSCRQRCTPLRRRSVLYQSCGSPVIALCLVLIDSETLCRGRYICRGHSSERIRQQGATSEVMLCIWCTDAMQRGRACCVTGVRMRYGGFAWGHGSCVRHQRVQVRGYAVPFPKGILACGWGMLG